MIYLDNAATTPLDGDVLRAMSPYFTQNFGNAQSRHAMGRSAAAALMSARDKTAEIFGCKSDEVIFMSGGTEAGNFAVKGACLARGKGHIVISAIEHPCVYESAKSLEERGFEVTIIEPDGDGVISGEAVERGLRSDTIFCAVMAVNNETGVIQPYEEIGKICRERGVFYYCDFVQAVGFLPFPKYASAFAVSAHKFYGPKGIAAMCLKSGSRVVPFMDGGRQERGLRGGTSDVPSAVGLAAALERATDGASGDAVNKKIAALSERFIKRVEGEIECAVVNGKGRAPSIVNLSFEGLNGANILDCLDLKGICVSNGSACSAGAPLPSRVITSAWGENRAKSAVRFSFGKYNTLEEADAAVDALKEIITNMK